MTDAETRPGPAGSLSMTDDAGPAAVARARAGVYGLFAAAFDGEIETLVEGLRNDAFVRIAEWLPVDLSVDPLRRESRDPESLKIGYDNLFVVPGPHYVPPFASAHVHDPSESFESDSPYHDAGSAGELLGDPAARASHQYAAVGFDPDRGDGIPDHVAASFEFMSALCSQEAAILGEEEVDGEALAAIREQQARTLDRLGWLDLFDEAVSEEDAAEGVFATLVKTARTFAAWDAMDGVREYDDEPPSDVGSSTPE